MPSAIARSLSRKRAKGRSLLRRAKGLAPGSLEAAAVQRTAYDIASESRLIDFTNADDIGLNEALQADLSIIRRRARFEMRQNGVAKGLGRTYANVVVGRGPTLKIRSKDSAWGQEVESAFAVWAKSCEYRKGRSLGQFIHLGVRQFFPCGEFFTVPRIDHRSDDPVKLRFLMIRPDRIASPSSRNHIADGVETDSDGRPLRYWVMKEDPDNANNYGFYSEENYDPVPWDQMIHVFGEEDPIQNRGEPWLATALKIFHKIRRADEGVITAIEQANKFAGFICNLIPDLAIDQAALIPSVMELFDGTLTTLPPGYEPKQIKPEHPNANLHEFRRDQLAAAGRGAGSMPVNAVTGDSSQHNFASARFDGLMLITDGDVTRLDVENQGLDRMFRMWYREAQAARVIRPAPVRYSTRWLWPKSDPHTDPLKGAKAQGERLKNGTATVGDLVLETGRDDVDQRARTLEEVQWYRDNQLTHPLERAAGGGGGAGAGAAAARDDRLDDIEEILDERS